MACLQSLYDGQNTFFFNLEKDHYKFQYVVSLPLLSFYLFLKDYLFIAAAIRLHTAVVPSE